VAVAATYIANNQLSIVGNDPEDLEAGWKIKANCGIDGYKTVTVGSFTVDGGNITITVEETSLTSNLTSIRFAPVGPSGIPRLNGLRSTGPIVIDTLSPSLPVASDADKKLVTLSVSAFKALLTIALADVSGVTPAAIGAAPASGSPNYLNIAEAYTGTTDGPTVTIDLATLPSDTMITLTGTGRSYTFINIPSKGLWRITWKQGTGGSKNVGTWTGITWTGGTDPTFSTAAGARDFSTLYAIDGVLCGSFTKGA
jgi:hypothetical protein